MINKLKQIQEASRLTDQELADKIGVSRMQWYRVKTGMRYGRKFLDGAKAAFPDIFLPVNVNTVNKAPKPRVSPLLMLLDRFVGRSKS